MSSTTNVLSPSMLAMLNGSSNASSAPAASSSATSGSSSSVAGVQSMNQLDFLNLMMEQLKNQDPTKPMDQAALAGQLAQFGTVSGINNLNTSFANLSAQLVSNQALQASSLLGHNVLVNGSAAPLAAGGTVHGAVSVPTGATGVTVQIVDPSGAVVRTLPLDSASTGLNTFTWDGKTDSGATAAAGSYAIVAAGNVSGKGQQLQTLVQGQVGSITLNGSGGGLTLHLTGLGDVPFSAVQQIN